MVLMMKKNRQLRVPDERKKEMLDAGYAVVDAKSGQVLEEPTEGAAVKLKKETAALKKEVAKLKKENEELAEQLAKAAKQ